MIPRTTPEPIGTPIFDSVVRVCAKLADGQLHFIGTAVTIGANLVLTARHVISEIADTYGKLSLAPSNTIEDVEVYFIQTRTDSAGSLVCNFYSVRASTSHPNTDLALTLAQLTDSTDIPPAEFPRSRLRAVPPKVGERIKGFGFPWSVAKFRPDRLGNRLELTDRPVWAEGEVVAVHDWKRDRGLYSFPCFQTNAQFDPGMSGGPVFDDNGDICGIISGSMSTSEANQTYVSYASAIWPLLAWRFPFRSRSGEFPEHDAYLYQLAKQGAFDVADLGELIPYLEIINNTRKSERR